MGLVETGHLPLLRKEEIDTVRAWFKPGLRILEIGGGNGYQANLIASWGCDVQSIDIPQERSDQQCHFPVQVYDGQHIPFPDNSFDLVFSSNVLEHVEQLDLLLDEIRRVLRVEGVALHIVPSPFWRVWTSLAHYIAILRHCVHGGSMSHERRDDGALQQAIQKRGLWGVVGRTLFASPHGVYPNAFLELYYFGRARWSRVLQNRGLELVESRSSGLFYTGYGLMPGLSMQTRRRLAQILGSACNIFLLRKLG